MKNKQRISYVLLFVAFIGIWHILSLGRKTLIFPSPYEVCLSTVSILRSALFLPTVFNTLKSVLLSFALAFIPALILGIFSHFIPYLYGFMENVSGIIRSVPTVSIILIVLLLLPVSVTPIVICFFVVFPVLYTNVAEGLSGVDRGLLEMARIYCVSRMKIVRHIYIPSLRSFLIAGSRSALGLSFKIVVTSEVFHFANHNSIGSQMYMHKINIDLAGIMAWTIIVVLLSILFDLALKKLFERGRRND